MQLTAREDFIEWLIFSCLRDSVSTVGKAVKRCSFLHLLYLLACSGFDAVVMIEINS
jgi:hypothetical protein